MPEKHPHVRGEDTFGLIWQRNTPETPPRAWGRHQTKDNELVKARNTPTCVGKTTYETA